MANICAVCSACGHRQDEHASTNPFTGLHPCIARIGELPAHTVRIEAHLGLTGDWIEEHTFRARAGVPVFCTCPQYQGPDA